MLNNALNIIDFSSGVRAKDINFNFSVVEEWIKRERLRTSGYGLVEGFDLSFPNNFVIDVSAGMLIDNNGSELLVDENKIECQEPAYEKITEEVIVDSEGKFKLKYKPYSPTRYGLIYYNPPEDNEKPLQAELVMVEKDSQQNMLPLACVDNVVTVSADTWNNKTATVTYYYCDDRIDAILLDENKTYSLIKGILSTSPSVADIEEDLANKYMIGFAHWIIGRTISVEFIIDERTYRKVYVDRNNVLYLNGKPYKDPKFIYFKEPTNPQKDDLWYDRDSNTLSSWEVTGGVYGWRVVNDFTNVPLRILKIWYPKDNPGDLQTFKFDDSETDLRYIPGTNALEITIDQQTVMSDQYDEIILEGSKSYLSSGIGFKLKAPLDRAAVVQVIVHQIVKNAPLKNVFQRAAIFVDENYIAYTKSNTAQVFETELGYVVNNDQLEVFVNGNRLNKNVDFVEMSDANNTVKSTDKAIVSKYFKVTMPLTDGQKVTYKISRYVWSYDQLNIMMNEIENKADTALSQNSNLQTQINNINSNLADKMLSMNNQIAEIQKAVKDISGFRLKADKIGLDDVTADIRSNLYNGVQHYTFNASDANNTVSSVKNTDYIDIFYIDSSADARELIPNSEYMLTYTNGNVGIQLISNLMKPTATLLVTVIRFGR